MILMGCFGKAFPEISSYPDDIDILLDLRV